MSGWYEARLRDNLCVAVLRASTPTIHLRRNDADARAGISAYADEPHRRRVRDPREVLKECIECGAFFWTLNRTGVQTYCEDRCRNRRFQRLWCRKRKIQAIRRKSA